LPRFLDIFTSIDAIENKLVWLPTWHQARQICRERKIPAPPVTDNATGDLISLYRRILASVTAG